MFVLEGGYDLRGLAVSGAAVVHALLGDPAPPVEGDAPGIDRLVEAYHAALAPYWPRLR